MAMENKRIIQLSTERLTLSGDDYVMVDSATDGSAKYRLDRLKETDTTLSVSGKAADAAATGQAINDEAEARAAADTALGNDVDDLKSAIYSDEYLPTWVGGWIDYTNGRNADSYPTVRIRTNNYIDLKTGLTVEFVGSKTVKINAVLYDADRQYIAAYWANAYIGTDASKKIYTQDDFQKDYPTAKYIRFAFAIYPEETIDAADAEDWLVMHTGIFYGEQLIASQNIDSNKTAIDRLAVSEKGYIHIENASTVRTTVNSNGTISLVFGYKLIVCFNSAFGTTLEWSDISTNIASYITISGNSATIIVPNYRSLVLNLNDLKLYFRSNNVLESDFVIISNGSYLPQGWAVDMENYQLRLTSNDILNRQGTGKYTTKATDIVTDCTAFSSLMLDVAKYESFIFFTDPHWMGGLWNRGTDGEIIVYDLFALLERYRNATNVTFALCGGDWLDNSDTEAEASFKMGFIKGSMKNLAPYYMLVGNHDTNYQGVDTLSAQSISNLWYDGKKSYFDFNGLNTHFYCFDTGVENENIDYEQAEWFANALLSDSSDHIALAMHILYYALTPSPTIQPLAQTVLDIAQAYNNRTSITVNGHSYNYASASGKVEFLLAGHTHVDGNYTVNGIPCVVTRNAWIPSSSTYAFDLVCINYDDRKINLIRVGNGSDREITF